MPRYSSLISSSHVARALILHPHNYKTPLHLSSAPPDPRGLQLSSFSRALLSPQISPMPLGLPHTPSPPREQSTPQCPPGPPCRRARVALLFPRGSEAAANAGAAGPAHQLVMSRKKAQPAGLSWKPSSRWNSEMSTSLSVVPRQLNFCISSGSRSTSMPSMTGAGHSLPRLLTTEPPPRLRARGPGGGPLLAGAAPPLL